MAIKAEVTRVSKEIIEVSCDSESSQDDIIMQLSQYTPKLIKEHLISKEPRISKTKDGVSLHYRARRGEGDRLEERLQELIGSIALPIKPESKQIKKFTRLPLPFDFLCRITAPTGVIHWNRAFSWKRERHREYQNTLEQLDIDLNQPTHKEALDLLRDLMLITLSDNKSSSIVKPTLTGALVGKILVALAEGNINPEGQFFTFHRMTLTEDQVILVPVRDFLDLVDSIVHMLLIQSVSNSYYFMPNPFRNKLQESVLPILRFLGLRYKIEKIPREDEEA
ncbi:MAG: hypothetical protein ACFFCZ_18100 [Promethearchaeota archaeon]